MAADFSLSPKTGTSFDFGSVNEGSANAVRVFVLKNTGQTDTIVTSQGTAQSSFQIQSPVTGQVLAPGASLEVSVALATNEPGSKSTELPLFITDDPEAVVSPSAGLIVSGYVTAKTPTNLGTVGETHKTSSGTVDIKRDGNAIGTFIASTHEKVLKFGLSGLSNELTLGIFASDVPNAEDPEHQAGDLVAVLARDANGNGLLDRSEYAQSLLNGGAPLTIAGDAGRQELSATGLSPGTYFVHLAAINGFAGGGNAVVVGYDVDLSAVTLAPDISVTGLSAAIADGDPTPSSLDGTDFGFVASGVTGPTRSFVVTNAGRLPLALGTVSATGGFEIVSGLPESLAAGESAEIIVRLGAGAPGSYSGTISFSTNVIGKNPFNFEVRGVVAQMPVPVMSVWVGQTQLGDGQASPISFGSVVSGSSGPARTFTVRNDGSATLLLSNLLLPAGYMLTEPLTGSLEPGRSDTFQVILDTNNAGTFTGNLTFTSNVTGQETFDVPLSGSVTPFVGQPQAPKLQVTLNDVPMSDGQSTVNFGAGITGGVAIMRTFTVTNTGNAALTLGAPVMPAGFSLTEGLSSSLAPGASDTFTISMPASAAGAFSGNVTFASNDPSTAAFDFAVTGEVADAPLVAVSRIDMTGIPAMIVGGTKSATRKISVTVTNNSGEIQSSTFATTLFAAADRTRTPQDAMIGSTSKRLKLKPGQSKTIKVKVTFNAPPADGDYNILAEGTFNSAPAGSAVGPSAIRLEQPRVTIDPGGVGSAVQTFRSGAKTTLRIPIINRGNVPAKGRVVLEIAAGPADSGQSGPAQVLLTLPRRSISLVAGTMKVLPVRFQFPATIPAGINPNGFNLIIRVSSSDFQAPNSAEGAALAVFNSVFLSPS